MVLKPFNMLATTRVKHIIKCEKCGKTIASYYAIPWPDGVTATAAVGTIPMTQDEQEEDDNKPREIVIKEGIYCKTCHQIEKLKE